MSLTAPALEDWVPAAPFRAQLLWLAGRCALDWREVALLTGIPLATAHALVRPRPRLSRPRIRRRDAATLFATTPQALESMAAARLLSPTAARRATELSKRLGAGRAADAVGLSVRELDALANTGCCSRLVAARLALLTDLAPTAPSFAGMSERTAA